MSNVPTLDNIKEVLARACEELSVTLDTGKQPVVATIRELPRVYRLQDKKATIVRLIYNGRWDIAAPAFLGVQEWVEVHWSAARPMQPPEWTVTTGEKSRQPGERQLDARTAAKKLIAAAGFHGAEAVAKYASEFASHGLIEIHSIHLLKGPPIHQVKRLDDYCTLLPYREALRRVDTQSASPPTLRSQWPSERADNVCALECRSFVNRTVRGDGDIRHIDSPQYTSPLLRFGTETLALMLGLVWGYGFRVFGHWHNVLATAADTVPFSYYATSAPGGGDQRVVLVLQGYGPTGKKRPLAVDELSDLVERYAGLPEQSRRILELAMRRLRDNTERMEHEDRVIDVCVALESLFMEDGEDWNHNKLIRRRASWYYADSGREREQTRRLLKEFYDHRSDIVHGKTSDSPSQEDRQRHSRLLADVTNVLRASIKSMICEGRPGSWEESKDARTIRHDPPRPDSEIPSVKSDSLSWTVAEQREIDDALEAVWKPTVEAAPTAAPGAESIIHMGVTPDRVEPYRTKGIPYVIRHPARLYMAHPKWPKAASDDLDERVEYYCERDVERHMLEWQKAASEKRLIQFELSTDATFYLPGNRKHWPRPLD